MSIVLLNFKAYPTAIGEGAVKLAQIAKEIADSMNKKIIIVPQAADLSKTSQIIEAYAQHVDPIDLGSGTGTQTVEAAKSAGATGSFLNHSEQNIPSETIKRAVEKLKAEGMKSVVCAPTPEKCAEYAAFSPDYIAIEPPELIGSGISVSTAQPEIITNSINKVKEVADIPVLCGAGISKKEDVQTALELGAAGVLLASAFTKAQDPKAVLEDICGGL